jgi:hypothetical protein
VPRSIYTVCAWGSDRGVLDKGRLAWLRMSLDIVCACDCVCMCCVCSSSLLTKVLQAMELSGLERGNDATHTHTHTHAHTHTHERSHTHTRQAMELSELERGNGAKMKLVFSRVLAGWRGQVAAGRVARGVQVRTAVVLPKQPAY